MGIALLSCRWNQPADLDGCSLTVTGQQPPAISATLSASFWNGPATRLSQALMCHRCPGEAAGGRRVDRGPDQRMPHLDLVVFHPDQAGRLGLSECVTSGAERRRTAERPRIFPLPRNLPPQVARQIGSVELATHYRTGDRTLDVGGDWFDAVPVDDGLMLVMGDVEGHDSRAAALMPKLRAVTRVAARQDKNPATVLARASDWLDRIDSDLFATALVVHIDLDTRVATSVCRAPGAGSVEADTGRHGAEPNRARDGATLAHRTGMGRTQHATAGRRRSVPLHGRAGRDPGRRHR